MWHLPAFSQATLDDDPSHACQHLCFSVSAALFWWALVHGRFGRLGGYGAALLRVHHLAAQRRPGALFTFLPRLWYPIYEARTAAWGLSPLEDQQFAGLILRVPAGIVSIVLDLALFAAWLGETERRVVAHTRRELLRELEGGGTEHDA